MSLYKMFTKLVDEKNNRIFCCVRVPDFEPNKIWFLSYEESYTYYEYKKQNKYPSFYSIFNMSSCRKPEIQKA